jgi:hypothetical protein
VSKRWDTWQLARLTLRAQAFVRAQSSVAQRTRLPQTAGGLDPHPADELPPRPARRRAVPPGRQPLLKGLSAEARELFQLDVLHPPTFELLSRTLRAANSAGQPYHVVHFDGHGVYAQAALRNYATCGDRARRRSSRRRGLIEQIVRAMQGV